MPRASRRGDLSQQLLVEGADEIGTLAEALRAMVGRLREMIQTSEARAQEADDHSKQAEKAMQESREAQERAERAKAEGLAEGGQPAGRNRGRRHFKHW